MGGKFSLWRNAWWQMGIFLMGFGVIITIATLSDEHVVLALLVGGGMIIAGAALAIRIWLRACEVRELMETGRCVWGRIIHVETDTRLRFNGRYPKRLVADYAVFDGVYRSVKSDSVFLSGAEYYVGSQVRIWISREDDSRYYVDVKGLLQGAGRF